MHQEVQEGIDKPDRQSILLEDRGRLYGQYRNAIMWACRVLDYKNRFEREEDFDIDGLDEHINFLKEDSRRELKEVSLYIRGVRKKIIDINNQLMDLAKERNERE